jgi:hypothetical protein
MATPIEIKIDTTNATEKIGGIRSHSQGYNTRATGIYSHAEGFNSIATGDFSNAGGKNSTASLPGEWCRSSGNSNFTAQYGIIDLSRRTSNATITEVYIGGIINARLTVASGKSMRYKFTALAMTEGTIASKEWEGQGLIKNVAGTTSLVGSSNISTYGDAAMASTTLTVSADNTNDCLKFEVTGLASTNIRWYIKVDYIRI